MKSFQHKVAAITGAGSGIGRALAEQLAAQGCSLALSDVNEPGLQQTARTIALRHADIKISTQKVDVSQREQIEDWAQQTQNTHGQINLNINNAGVAHVGSVEASSYEDYEWLMAINYWGVVYGSKAFLPHLKASGDGHIVNISSVFGLFAQPMFSAYNSSKFAVRGFTEALRQELDIDKSGVSASCVHPGGVKTDIARNARVDGSFSQSTGMDHSKAQSAAERMFQTTPEQAAARILKGVKRNERRILVGRDAQAADWLQRSSPAAYQRLLTFALQRLS